MRKTLPMTDDLYDYIAAHTTAPDPLVEELSDRTSERFGRSMGMLTTPQQATLLTMLAHLVGARRAVEVGTFTGMSSLAVARALPPDGKLTCFDISAEYTSLAREFWAKAGVADRIELRLGPAAEGLAALPAEPHIDLAFVDADKTGYAEYWALLVPRMRRNGMIVVDNVLWDGKVLHPEPGDADTEALARFNAMVVRDDRVEVVMLPFADGVTLARVR
jgi:caffeoyl-CoA O-methyltransferase